MTNNKLEYPEQQLVEKKYDKNDEEILVFPRENIKPLLKNALLNNGVFKDNESLFQELNIEWEEHGTVKRRGDVENDESFVQPIPYITVKRGRELFTYTRLSGSGEQRLHGKSSVGIGGHMNLEQEEYWNFEHLIALGAARELEEEVSIINQNNNEITNHYELAKGLKVLGVGYSTETEVDSVHLAIFLELDVPEDWTVKVKETDTLEGGFKQIDEIKQLGLENWSKMAIKLFE